MNFHSSARSVFVMVVTLLLMVVATSEAEARRIAVWYSDISRPPQYSKRDVIAVIQDVMSEWEQHTYGGRLILEWRGEVEGALPTPDNSTIVIYWDPNIDVGLCGETCQFGTFNCVGGPAIGRVRLNPWMNVFNNGVQTRISINLPTWDTIAPTSCSLRTTLMHELAHLFLDTGDHPSNSVLRSPLNSIQGRHLWEADVLPSNNWFLPNHSRAIMMESVNRVGVVSASILSDFLPASSVVVSPVALAMGDGLPAGGVDASYAITFGGDDPVSGRFGLFFLLGDGRQWPFVLQFLCESQFTCTNGFKTYRRPCVVNSTNGTHYYIVWAANNQQPNGARALLSIESHTWGTSWSAPEVIPGAFTRAGVSCTLDPQRDRVVLAYAGAGTGEDGIFLLDRSATNSGPGNWSSPRMIQNEGGLSVAPRTANVPYVVFDQFGGASPGRLAWFDDLSLTPRTANLFFDGTQYTIGTVQTIWDSYVGGTPSFTTAERLRSIPVIDFEGFPVLGLSLNELGTQQRQHWQWNLESPPPQQAFSISYDSVAASVIRRYTGSASNRNLVETALVSTTLRNPN